MSDPSASRSSVPALGAGAEPAAPPEAATVSPETVTQPPEIAATPWTGKVPLELPAQFGRYRLEKLLGKGGMGSVYLAHDSQLDRRVALKIPRFGPDEADMRERFLREARAAATLHHPNLCPVFDVGELDGVFYLTMAYIEGEPLSVLIRADNPMPANQAAGLVRQLALALHEAHAHGIIHRDLKPANIMIGRKNVPVIMDFGLARREVAEDERLTRSGAVMGTPAYMPPEQVNGDVAAMGPGCDIYSLGIILYELLAGRRPFDGPPGVLMAQILRDPPLPIAAWRPNVDLALETICLQALAKRPQDRHASMYAFAVALERWLAGHEPPPVSPPLTAPMVRRASLATDVATTAAPAPRPTVRPRRAAAKPQPKPMVSPGQKWLLTVAGILLMTCILPAATLILVLFLTFWDGMARMGRWFERLNAEHKVVLEQDRLETQQWEAASTWTPPPADVEPTRLFPAKVGRYERTEHDDQAFLPGLMQMQMPPGPGIAPPIPPAGPGPAGPAGPNPPVSGRRALYQGPDGKVELFAYRMKRNEKDAAVQRIAAAIGDEGGLPGFGMLALETKGSATGRYLAYERKAIANGVAAQRGVFWWDSDWLFLARNPSGPNPGDFLKEYLKVAGAKGAAAK